MNSATPQDPDAALRQLRGVVAHCLHEADHLPEGTLLSQRWSIDAFDALRRLEALDDLITRHAHLPTDWAPTPASAPVNALAQPPDPPPTPGTEPPMITRPSDIDSTREALDYIDRPEEAPNVPECQARSNGLSLTLRASIAAHNRTAVSGPAATSRSWRERAAHLTRLTSSILGVDPACVSVMPDPDRTNLLFAYTDIRLIVADTLLDTDPSGGFPTPSDPSVHDGGQYQFIAGARSDRTSALLLLRPCPECAELVPTYRIAALADLGQIILAERADPPPLLSPDAREFTTDPAHQRGCPQRQPTVRG